VSLPCCWDGPFSTEHCELSEIPVSDTKILRDPNREVADADFEQKSTPEWREKKVLC